MGNNVQCLTMVCEYLRSQDPTLVFCLSSNTSCKSMQDSPLRAHLLNAHCHAVMTKWKYIMELKGHLKVIRPKNGPTLIFSPYWRPYLKEGHSHWSKLEKREHLYKKKFTWPVISYVLLGATEWYCILQGFSPTMQSHNSAWMTIQSTVTKNRGVPKKSQNNSIMTSQTSVKTLTKN